MAATKKRDQDKIGPADVSTLSGEPRRSHRIDAEEFYQLLDGQVIDDTRLLAQKLQEWEDHYNYHRPHGALSGQTPYERLRQKAADPLS
jgi:transposase InsO family protein